MVIEFYGMPGSGKTTFANEIVKKKPCNISWINVVHKSRTSIGYKVYIKLMEMVAVNDKDYKKNNDKILDIVRDYRDVPAKFNEGYIDSYVKVIAFNLWLYKRMYSKQKIYIFDEGIVQQIINMCVNYDLDTVTAEKLVNYLSCGQESRIFYETSVECTEKSIMKRNRHVCFIDELTGQELREFLDKYNEKCHLLYRLTNSKKINRDEMVKDKEDVIFNALGLER